MAGQDLIDVCPDLTIRLNEKPVLPGSVVESMSVE
jgi:hypothetical protein